MARLPVPGSDNGTWGDVLNDFLQQALKNDGTIKDNAITANNLAPNSVTNAAIASDAVNATSIADGSITNGLISDGTIQEVKLSSAVQTKLNQTSADKVSGAASSMDKAIVRFDGATGKLVQDSLATIGDDGDITTPGIINASRIGNKPEASFIAANQAGTTAVSTDLQMLGTGAADTSFINGRFLNASNAPANLFVKSRGTTVGQNVIVQDGDHLGNIGFDGADGVGYFEGARIRARVDGVPATGSIPGSIEFYTTPEGSSSGVLAMAIKSTGKVAIPGGTIGASSSQQHTLPAVSSDTFTLNNAAQTIANKTFTSTALTGNTAISSGGELRIYNTADQTTNYERVRQYWTGNVWTLASESGGTGTARTMQFGTITSFIIPNAAGAVLRRNNTSTTYLLNITSTGLSASSGTQSGLLIDPTINQSGSANYTALIVNPSETATGTGSKLLADFQLGGVSKTRIDSTGSHYLSSSATNGMALYATTDETTNYERARVYWNSTVFTIQTDNGGTGSARSLSLRTPNTTFTLNSGSSAGIYQFVTGASSANGSGIRATGVWSASSGTNNVVSIEPTINQSSTAGYTVLNINPTESAIGSGTRLLINAQVGGVSKFSVDTTGAATLAAAGTGVGSVVTVDGTQTLTNKTFSGANITGAVALPTSSTFALYNTADQTTNYERLVIDWVSGAARIYTNFGGTAATRTLNLGVASTAGSSTVGTSFRISDGAPFFRYSRTSGTNGGFVDLGGITSSASSGISGIFVINPAINQTLTAGYTALLVNPTESATGSGTKLLADFQLGGVSKVSITNLGQLKLAASVAGAATMNIPTGTVPTNPVTGDVYSDGTHVYCYLASTWKQLD